MKLDVLPQVIWMLYKHSLWTHFCLKGTQNLQKNWKVWSDVILAARGRYYFDKRIIKRVMGGKHCLVRIFNAEDKSERPHEKKKKNTSSVLHNILPLTHILDQSIWANLFPSSKLYYINIILNVTLKWQRGWMILL